MQLATVTLAIAGDRGTTVTKYDVTPSEVAVLRFLHGDDAVTDIELTGETKRKHAEERDRLAELYGRQIGERRVAVAVNALFPGAAARLFDTFSELDLPDEFYKAETRKLPTAEKPKRGKKAEAQAEAPAEPDEEIEDGGTEMPDNHLFK